MKKLLIILSMCFLLSGCFETFCKNTAGISEKEVRIEQAQLQECPEFVKLIDPDKLLEVSLENLAIGRKCALMQKDSVKLLKEFANKK